MWAAHDVCILSCRGRIQRVLPAFCPHSHGRVTVEFFRCYGSDVWPSHFLKLELRAKAVGPMTSILSTQCKCQGFHSVTGP